MFEKVADARVWKHIKWMFVGSMAIFSLTVVLGFLNLDTAPDVPRQQVLSHFHAATIGWITFTFVTVAIWLFTGQRTVSEGYAKGVATLGTVAFVAFAGYAVSFFVAFGQGGNAFYLLPLFGIPSWLVILSTFIFTLGQLRKQPVVTTAHLLVTGAFFIASLGATMGVLLGLGYATGNTFIPGPDPIGTHAGVMDTYTLLGFAAILDAVLRPAGERWTKPGLTQALLWVLSALVIWVALLTGMDQELAPIAMLALITGLGFYLARTGWQTFRINPFAGGRQPALFWGGLFFPLYVVVFVVMIYHFIQGLDIPHWLFIIFAHILGAGSGTNLILTTISIRASATDRILPRAEPWALWTFNLGFLAFIAGEYLEGVAWGAVLMGAGAVWALLILYARLMALGPKAKPAEQAPA